MGQKMETKSGAKVATGWPSVSSVRLRFSASFVLLLMSGPTQHPVHPPTPTHIQDFPVQVPTIA